MKDILTAPFVKELMETTEISATCWTKRKWRSIWT